MDFQYKLPSLDNIEDIEKYRLGGFHPVHIGDSFKDGRYDVFHKLGYGGFSTVWLACDQRLRRLVSLKVLTAEASHQLNELKFLQYLDQHAYGNPIRKNILPLLDFFTIQGPNGTHMCYVSEVGGPSISSLVESPGEIAGTRRPRAALARKLAGQLANTVSLLHSIDIVHGDITPKNVLIRLKNIDEWTIDDIRHHAGRPVKEEVFTSSGAKPSISAPNYLVEPLSFEFLTPQDISNQILLIDLGEAFHQSSPPPNGVGIPPSYASPELLLERKASRESDLWALVCTLFEMRSGFPLFESFVGSPTEVLKEMIRILGPPPRVDWPSWEKQGIHIKLDALETEDSTGALSDRTKEIGIYDVESSMQCAEASLAQTRASANLIENSGARISQNEANSLAGLLQRVLDYEPGKRLTAGAIANHRWLVDNF